MVALDNSSYAPKVMRQAIELAKAYQAPLHVVSVIDDSYFGEADAQNAFVTETRDYWTMSVKGVLEKCLKLASDDGIDYHVEMLTGNPAEEIIKHAAQTGIDLIVLGHLGKSASAGFVIGSVAQKVAAYSKCSVHIVK